MTIWKLLAGFVVVVLLYVGLVLTVGYAGAVAITIHFGRVSFALAVLVIYLPLITTIFREVPAPRRDYLIAGIIFTWASAIGFAVWNEMGRRFGVDTSIFSNPIAGFFSLLLVVGAVFHVLAPDANQSRKIIALLLGVAAGGLVISSWVLFR